jgi:acetyl-CoA/propionyl-CoA carboxylase carboxyl transferase subunit
VGKAYGEAYETMCSKHVGADFSFAWPSAEIVAVAPGKSAGRDTRSNGASDGLRDTLASAYIAAQRGHIDDIIEPRETRPRLIASLEASVSKRESRPPKKHGTGPV